MQFIIFFNFCGAPFFCSLFFAGFSNGDVGKPAECKGIPFFIKLAVNAVIGMFKGAVVAVTVIIFKRTQTYAATTPREKANTVLYWTLKERSFTLVALGYQTWSCFFVPRRAVCLVGGATVRGVAAAAKATHLTACSVCGTSCAC